MCGPFYLVWGLLKELRSGNILNNIRKPSTTRIKLLPVFRSKVIQAIGFW
jgi:hypothetical protein